MIDGYAFSTPNGVKVPVTPEERGSPYALHAPNILQGLEARPALQRAMEKNTALALA